MPLPTPSSPVEMRQWSSPKVHAATLQNAGSRLLLPLHRQHYLDQSWRLMAERRRLLPCRGAVQQIEEAESMNCCRDV